MATYTILTLRNYRRVRSIPSVASFVAKCYQKQGASPQTKIKDILSVFIVRKVVTTVALRSRTNVLSAK